MTSAAAYFGTSETAGRVPMRSHATLQELPRQLGSGKTAAKGTAVFTSGDKADTSSTCSTEPKDAKGWVVVKCESEYRFTDGSMIVLLIDSSYDEKTMDARADARLISGKGRFEGISGKAAGTGMQGKMQWSGSYALPAKK